MLLTQGVEKTGVLVESQAIMKPANFTNFLESGALLRSSANNWFLLAGPFKAVAEKPADQVALFHPDFFMGPEQQYWIPESFYRLTDDQLAALLNEQSTEELPPMTWHQAELSSFSSSYDSILERIHHGSLKKAVPIVFEKSSESIRPARIVAMIKELMKAPTNLYVFGFWQEGRGILGATPEVLLKQDGVKLKTMALAGTCPKEDAKSRTSLLEDAKERHEHELVIQDIESSLASYGTVKSAETGILELPTLFHLKTDIECELPAHKKFSFFEACRSLHPTPALGVSPRSFGYEWMRGLPEQKERRGFGAPWGLSWEKDEALCLVAIRCLQWDEEGSRIGSGCGIVAQSDLQQEWRELFQKRQSVKKVLGLES